MFLIHIVMYLKILFEGVFLPIIFMKLCFQETFMKILESDTYISCKKLICIYLDNNKNSEMNS